MAGLVLTVMVVLLVITMTLGASPPLNDCVEKEVQDNDWTNVNSFTSKNWKVLLFPMPEFQGVRITTVVEGKGHPREFTRKDLLCVTSSQWYTLEVTLTPDWISHSCTLKIDDCKHDCGSITDLAQDDFEKFSVDARGASFWSSDSSGDASLCATPNGALTTPATTTAAPATVMPTPSSSLEVWLWSVGGVAVTFILLTGVYLVARRMYQPHRQQEDITAPAPPRPALVSPRPEEEDRESNEYVDIDTLRTL